MIKQDKKRCVWSTESVKIFKKKKTKKFKIVMQANKFYIVLIFVRIFENLFFTRDFKNLNYP